MGVINLLDCISGSCNIVQLLFVVFSVTFMSSSSLPIRNETGAMVLLEKYGDRGESVHHSKEAEVVADNALTERLTEFQRFSGKRRGKLGNEKLPMTSDAWCGVEDATNNSTSIRRKRYALEGSSWFTPIITYKIRKYSNRVKDKIGIDNVIKRAFKVWSDVSSLTFHERSRGRVDIDISFEVGEHGDGDDFDGPGGELGHANYPQAGGDVHFDDEENWTIDNRNGTSLFHVAAHEFGHALGILHSDDDKALMHKSYDSSSPITQLQDDDIKAIQALYGSPKNPVIKNPASIPDTRDAPDMCGDATIDAATRIQNGDTYFFRDAFYWKIQSDTIPPGYPRRISDDWGGLEGNLDAAFTWVSGKTFFFKGGKYWRFTNMGMDLGYPRDLSTGFEGIPEGVDAAFVWSGNDKTYFFKGDQYWLYDSTRDPPVRPGYPKPLRNWRGLPNNIDAAFKWENERTYFFKGKKFYRFNDEDFQVDSENPPYPRPTSAWWFHCRPVS